jgi:SOS response regulatory protein OraA/RecX
MAGEATELALRALRHRDRSRQDLDQRLAREGVPVEERERALDELAATGALSDDRFAEERARSLTARNASDTLIRSDLRRHGISDDVVARVLEQVEPEGKRAERIFHRRGAGDRALRYLAGKGFGRDSLEALAPDRVD